MLTKITIRKLQPLNIIVQRSNISLEQRKEKTEQEKIYDREQQCLLLDNTGAIIRQQNKSPSLMSVMLKR
jgi:hypothetical protein